MENIRDKILNLLDEAYMEGNIVPDTLIVGYEVYFEIKRGDITNSYSFIDLEKDSFRVMGMEVRLDKSNPNRCEIAGDLKPIPYKLPYIL